MSDYEAELLGKAMSYFGWQGQFEESDIRVLSEIRAVYEKYAYFGHLALVDGGNCSREAVVARFVFRTGARQI